MRLTAAELPERPAVVLLDLDDTLVDTRAAFAVAVSGVSRTWLPHLDDAGRQAAVQHWIADPGGWLAAYTRGEITLDEQRLRRADALHARFDGPVLDDASFARWNGEYEQLFTGALGAHAEALPLLRRLGALGLPCAVVTNAATGHQEEKLRRAGLGGHARFVLGWDAVGVAKPDPAIFLEACRRLGVEPGRSVYVGDEPFVDAAGARNAGLTGVWLRRPGVALRASERPPPAELWVESLDELADRLAQRLAG